MAHIRNPFPAVVELWKLINQSPFSYYTGLIQKWYEVTESAIIDHFRLVTPSEDESMKPLSLIDIQTSFYILAIGLSMCAVVFVAELLCSKCPRTTLSVVQEDYYLVQEKASGINK